MPITSISLVTAVRTTARMAAFMPGESPPLVITPIFLIFSATLNLLVTPLASHALVRIKEKDDAFFVQGEYPAEAFNQRVAVMGSLTRKLDLDGAQVIGDDNREPILPRLADQSPMNALKVALVFLRVA